MEGEGLVLTMPKTLYYGTFKGGRPEGECTALQVVELDAPRYDYSQGIVEGWEDGGLGHTGYCYYETSRKGKPGMCARQEGFPVTGWRER